MSSEQEDSDHHWNLPKRPKLWIPRDLKDFYATISSLIIPCNELVVFSIHLLFLFSNILLILFLFSLLKHTFPEFDMEDGNTEDTALSAKAFQIVSTTFG